MDKHNSFAERIPVIKEQIKVLNHRMEDIENLCNHAGKMCFLHFFSVHFKIRRGIIYKNSFTARFIRLQ